MNIEVSNIPFFHTIKNLFSDAQLYTIKTEAKTSLTKIFVIDLIRLKSVFIHKKTLGRHSESHWK